MIREEKFLISRKPFAVDLGSLSSESQTVHNAGTEYERHIYRGRIEAVWFRRKHGTTYACLGSLKLWGHNLPRRIEDIEDPVKVLSADLDSGSGGDCHGRWDGDRYWGAQEPDVIERHLELLRPMLANYPAVPDGYDGWWRF